MLICKYLCIPVSGMWSISTTAHCNGRPLVCFPIQYHPLQTQRLEIPGIKHYHARIFSMMTVRTPGQQRKRFPKWDPPETFESIARTSMFTRLH